ALLPGPADRGERRARPARARATARLVAAARRRCARRDLVPLARGPAREALPRGPCPGLRLPAGAPGLRLPRRTGGRAGDAPRAAADGLLPALRRLYERAADHPLIDRLIGGRAWIGLVAFALIGIVTLQLGLLELNTHIGRVLEREGRLQRENAALSIQNS